MRPLIKILLTYYLPVVIVFTLIDFFHSDYKTDIPIDIAPFKRFLVAFLGSATFSAESFQNAWSEFGNWLSFESLQNIPFFERLLALLRLTTYGFLITSFLLIPLYAYAWVAKKERRWEKRFLVLKWREPRFRHILLATKIPILAITTLCYYNWAPLLPTIFLTLGGIAAIKNPVLLTIPLGILDLYEVQPPRKLINYFASGNKGQSRSPEGSIGGGKPQPGRNPTKMSNQNRQKHPTAQPPTQKSHGSGRLSPSEQKNQPPLSWRDRINKKR